QRRPARGRQPGHDGCRAAAETAGLPRPPDRSRARHGRAAGGVMSAMLPPGAWLGVLGGGQLGRMFCQAAPGFGLPVGGADPARSRPAGMVADEHIRAAYDDADGLDRLAQRCAAVTTEFENVPADSLHRLARTRTATPSGNAVAVAQDRLAEKNYIQAAGVPVAPHAAIRSVADVQACPGELFPGILKTVRFGYDGKGQVRVASHDEARQAFEALRGVPCILEALQPLDYETSVVVARDPRGRAVSYAPSRNTPRTGFQYLMVVYCSVAVRYAHLSPYRVLMGSHPWRGAMPCPWPFICITTAFCAVKSSCCAPAAFLLTRGRRPPTTAGITPRTAAWSASSSSRHASWPGCRWAKRPCCG